MQHDDLRFIVTTIMPRLANLAETRKQASYQRARAAGEHKATWQSVIDVLDSEIQELEHVITHRLELNRFRWKMELRP